MEELRLLFAAISIGTTMALFIRFNDQPEVVGRRLRYLIVAMYGIASVGILEHYLRHSDLTFAVAAWTGCCIGVLVTLWRTRAH